MDDSAQVAPAPGKHAPELGCPSNPIAGPLLQHPASPDAILSHYERLRDALRDQLSATDRGELKRRVVLVEYLAHIRDFILATPRSGDFYEELADGLIEWCRGLGEAGDAERLRGLSTSGGPFRNLAVGFLQQALVGDVEGLTASLRRADAFGSDDQDAVDVGLSFLCQAAPYFSGLALELFPPSLVTFALSRHYEPPAPTESTGGDGAGVQSAGNTKEPEWSRADMPSQWARVFGVNVSTLKRRLKDGQIRNKKLTSKSYQIAVDDLPAGYRQQYRQAGK